MIITRSGRIRGMGRVVKEAISRYLSGMSEYHAIKYGSDNQNPSLRDIYRMARPKSLEGTGQAIAQYLVKGELDLDALPQIATYEQFKRMGDITEDEAVKMIVDGNLPYEVITAIAPNTKKVWEAMMKNAPYMNMLRNLRNYGKYGVFDDPGNVDHVAKVLSDPRMVARSKQFPFRYISAAREIGPGNTKIVNALNDALVLSVDNVPEIPGYAVVANDISWSMSDPISERSKVTCYEVAGVLGAILFKKCDDGQIVSFDTRAHPRNVNQRDSVLTIAKNISGAGGGTDLGAAVRYMKSNKYAMTHKNDLPQKNPKDGQFMLSCGSSISSSSLYPSRSFRCERNDHANEA